MKDFLPILLLILLAIALFIWLDTSCTNRGGELKSVYYKYYTCVIPGE